MEVIQQLKQDGIAKGLCQPWQNKLRDGVSVKRLVDLYVRGIDFCIKNDYPTLEFIRDNFKGKCEQYGVYIDDSVTEKDRKTIVLNGDCKAMLEYGGYSVSTVFVRHNSQAAIVASKFANVTIDAFDNSHLVVAVTGKARVSVNLYGDASVEVIGNDVKIRKTNKRVY